MVLSLRLIFIGKKDAFFFFRISDKNTEYSLFFLVSTYAVLFAKKVM